MKFNCPRCGNSYNSSKFERCPICTEQDRAYYRKTYLAHLSEAENKIKLVKPEIKKRERKSIIVKGIKITPLRKDFQKVKPLTIVESVVASMTSIMKAWSRNRHVFYSHVDIPELKCSIILRCIYRNGLTIGYNDTADQIYIRKRGQCWQKFDFEVDELPED